MPDSGSPAEASAAHSGGAAASFDVFLSHNGRDRTVVERIAERLKRARLDPWLDTWHLVPGSEWQRGLAEGLAMSRSCAVFVGPSDLGAWENQEVAVALDRAATDAEFRLFLVLLPGVPERFDAAGLSPFLRMRTWVDYRSGFDDERAFRTLVSAIRGLPPGPEVPIEPEAERCPYRGLEVFEEEHAEFFFGREADVQRLLEKLKATRFLAVLGASGSGKSSLVRAGLIPALKRGEVSGERGWEIATLRPGPHPLEALSAQLLHLGAGGPMHETLDALGTDPRTLHLASSLALAERAAGTRLLLVIDQFEEVFTLCRDEGERNAFFANLLYAATIPGGASVLLTMRADFYHRCGAYPELAQQLAAAQYLVSPLQPEGLRQAIEEPARRVGLAFEPGLVSTILDDVAAQPGALPLLEHALLEAWRRRTGGMLTLAGYRESGGVEGAIAKRAEQVFETLGPSEQELARRTLLRLTQPGEGTEDTRRRARLAELESDTASGETAEILTRLVNARLVTTSRDEAAGGEVVEVAHEALIRGWPRLRGWIEEDRAGLLVHRRITQAAEEWQRLDRDEDALYRGARLAQALEWREGNEKALNDLEREFLAAGEAAARTELEVESRRLRRLRMLAAAVGVVAVAATALAVVALLSRRQAVKQERVASSRQLAAQADLTSQRDPVLSVLLSLTAFNTAKTAEARAALLHQAELRRDYQRIFTTDAIVESLALTADGRSLAAGLFDGRVMVWDVPSGEQRAVLAGPVDEFSGFPQAVSNVAFSPDGRLLASGYGSSGQSSYEGDNARLWNLADGRRAATLPEGVWGVQFSPDGRTLALGRNDGIVQWDVAKRRRGQMLPGHSGQNTNVAFSPDARTLASVALHKPLTIWNLKTGTPRIFSRQGGFLPTLSFGPGGRTLAMGSESHVTLWDVLTGKEQFTLGPKQVGWEPVVALSPDGRTVAVGDSSGAVSLWDIASRKRRAHFAGHTQRVKSLVFSRDGSVLASGGEDARVILWSMRRVLAPVPVRGARIGNIAVSPDGRIVALAEFSRGWKHARVALWDLRANRRRALLPTGGDEVQGLAVSPDGRNVAAGGEHNDKVTIWDALTGKTRTTLDVSCCSGIDSLAFSSDGHTLGVADNSEGVILWDYITGRKGRILTLGQTESFTARSVAFSPDARIVAAGGTGEDYRGVIALWDSETGRRRAILATLKEVWHVAFSPDGRTLLSADDAGDATLWDVATAKRRATLSGANASAASIEVSSDGRTVAVHYADGRVVLWDAVERVLLGNIFTHQTAVSDIAFTADGDNLIAGGPNGELLLEDVRASTWSRRLCAIVSRDFTDQEWAQFAPQLKREPVCS